MNGLWDYKFKNLYKFFKLEDFGVNTMKILIKKYYFYTVALLLKMQFQWSKNGKFVSKITFKYKNNNGSILQKLNNMWSFI
jgi:hypothetical protein